MVCDCAAETANLAAVKSPSALTRRNDIPFHGTVNCAPAKGCVWPVLAPAQAIVRAGERRGLFGIRNAELGRGDARVSGVEVLLMRFALVHACCCGSAAALCARPCDSVGALCPRFARGLAILSGRFALSLRLLSRLYCGVCLRFTPVFFPLSGKKRRLAISCVPIPPGRDRHSCVLAASVRLSALVGSLRV